MLTNEYLKRVYETVLTRNPGESEFHQAVLEVLESLESVVEQHPEYEQNGIMERFVEPERFIQFSVPWVDDSGKVRWHYLEGIRSRDYSEIIARLEKSGVVVETKRMEPYLKKEE